MILLKLHQTKRRSYKLDLQLFSLAADNWSCKYAGWEILKVRLIYWHLHALLWLENAWHITQNY
jgi:hypothetical protein